jgi:hypothetical protein
VAFGAVVVAVCPCADGVGDQFVEVREVDHDRSSSGW